MDLGTVVWRPTSRRAAWRPVTPGHVIGGLLFIWGAVAGELLGGLILAISFMVIPTIRSALWFTGISRHELHISADRVRFVEQRNSYSMAWSEVRKIELYTGDRWPEWQFYATFAQVTVFHRDPWTLEMRRELFVMSKPDMDSLDKILADACRERSIAYRRY